LSFVPLQSGASVPGMVTQYQPLPKLRLQSLPPVPARRNQSPGVSPRVRTPHEIVCVMVIVCEC
jgi:hypothetical protein